MTSIISLDNLDKAKALVEQAGLLQLKEIISRADALKVYAQQAKRGLEIQNHRATALNNFAYFAGFQFVLHLRHHHRGVMNFPGYILERNSCQRLAQQVVKHRALSGGTQGLPTLGIRLWESLPQIDQAVRDEGLAAGDNEWNAHLHHPISGV